ncbi:MAG: hypothetical protein U0872_13465 [Planctomycetaceae bacterium]
MQVFLWFAQFMHRWRRHDQLRRAQRWHARLETQPRSLALEPRRVLNGAPIAPVPVPVPAPTHSPVVAEVVVNAGQFANDGKADTFVVTQTAAGDVVSVNGQVQQVVAPGTQLIIEGSNDADQVQIISSDEGAGNGTTIEFVGNGGQDTMQLAGSAQSVVHQFATDGTGKIVIDGTSVSYTAGVSVWDALQVGERTFELDGAEDLELDDSSTAGFDEARGQYGQDVTFAETSSKLRVDAAQNAPVANQVTVNDLDSSLQRNLEIDGDTADTVNLAGNINLHSGDLTVTAGTIDITGQIQTEHADVTLTATSQLTIAAEAGIEDHGGMIVADAGPQGTLLVSGHLDVSDLELGETGGAIHLLGNQVRLIGADVDARGDAGGGEILIGGDYQGRNPNVRNASQTVVDRQTTLNASAVNTGDGGKVIVWADEAAWYAGTTIARGGSQSGDGGFVETSGKAYLNASGSVDASSPHGAGGTWLLDPANITIDNNPDTNGAFDSGSPNTFTPTGDNAIADIGTIEASLNSGTNVVVTTSGAGSQAGDITVAADITKSAGSDATLALNADHNITINSGVTISSTTGKLNVDLEAANNLDATGSIINTNGGDLTVVATSGAVTFGTINTGAGNLTATAGAAITDAAGAALTVGGHADLKGSSITLNNPAANTYGSLTFNSAGAVTIVENDATQLTGLNTANSLSLTSTGAITDATGTSLKVTNSATLTGVGITLADQATDVLSVGVTATFDGGSGAIAIGPAGSTNFGNLTFKSTNAVSIQEDSATNLIGTSTANSLSLTSTGAITDAAGATLNVTNNGTFKSVGAVLADQPNNILSVGGTADFEAGTGGIIIGSPGTANFGSLTFNSTSNVSIQEKFPSTQLTGSNTANSLSLTSTGTSTDATGTTLNVTNNGTFTGIGITLADQATDTLTIGGTADLEASSGAIIIGPAGTANFRLVDL